MRRRSVSLYAVAGQPRSTAHNSNLQAYRRTVIEVVAPSVDKETTALKALLTPRPVNSGHLG